MAKPPLAHILIVEDDGELLEVLKYVLEDAGYATYSASDGEQALAMAESEPIDLVILDISMSGMSGIDVAHSLRSHPATSSILIAVHTGLPEEDVRAQLPDFDRFMLKGDDADPIVRMVSELLGSRATSSGSVEADGVLS